MPEPRQSKYSYVQPKLDHIASSAARLGHPSI